MLKYSISILLLLLSSLAFAQDLESEEDAPEKVAIVDSFHQLRFSFDVSRIAYNELLEGRNTYEFEIDYYHKKDLYFVGEFGFGTADFNEQYLSYSSSNTFFKLGINKSLLRRISNSDWDMGFIGLRYGVGMIQRNDATYSITDSTWGVASGTIAGANSTAHWVELTGGVRVELFKRTFIGWNARGKFLINGKTFSELPPYYIAGYGKGEKGTVFDFNVYLSYAIRWSAKHKKGDE